MGGFSTSFHTMITELQQYKHVKSIYINIFLKWEVSPNGRHLPMFKIITLHLQTYNLYYKMIIKYAALYNIDSIKKKQIPPPESNH